MTLTERVEHLSNHSAAPVVVGVILTLVALVLMIVLPVIGYYYVEWMRYWTP